MADSRVPPAMIQEFRSVIAGVVSDSKSYDVPALCRRIGLADGGEQEAFGSKFKYAQRRLAELVADDVVSVGRRLAAEHDDFRLSELIAKLDELGGSAVTPLTRRRLLGFFEGQALCSEIEEIDLIRSVWPIAAMRPPGTSSEASLESHILRHWAWNPDMTQGELLEMLGFLTCSRKQLFKFLSSVTGPEAQTYERQVELCGKINEFLVHDGYRLVEAGRMSGSPVYEVRPTPGGTPSDSAISIALAKFDPNEVGARWQEAMDSREAAPGRAITLARTLLEDVCKWIINEAGESYKESDDLPMLYRQLSKLLRLAPDDHTEQIFKQILGNCQSVVESLGALRNKLGDAHSIGPLRARPLPRHAALAVNLSGAMASFLVETWAARKVDSG